MAYNKTTGMYEGFIYCIENLINGKKYIGQTRQKNIQMRWYNHKESIYTKDAPLYKAFRKYGINNFKIYQIDFIENECLDVMIDELNRLEEYYIELYNTFKGDGYNADAGGKGHCNYLMEPVDAYSLDGTFLHSFESCSAADIYYGLYDGASARIASGKQNKSGDITFRFQGEPFDKYDPLAYKRSRTIYQFTLDGNLVATYSNITQAEIITGIQHMNIHKAILSHGISFGYVWQDTPDFSFNLDNYRNRMPVDQYTLSGKYLNTYASLSEACKIVGKDPTYVSGLKRCCEGKREYAYGYVWRFSGEPFEKYPVHTTQEQANNYKNRKPVDQYDKNGTLLNTYESYSEACKAVGKDSTWVSHIRKTCNGQKKSAFGYIWRDHGTPFDYDELMNIINEKDNTKLLSVV